MTNFQKVQLTKRGAALVAKAGIDISFTRAESGSGVYSAGEDCSSLRRLKDCRQEFGINSVAMRDSTTATVKFVISNKDLEEEYPLTEVGIYAEDPDAGEILYAVCYSTPEDAQKILAYNGIFETCVAIALHIKVADGGTVTMQADGVYALAEDVTELRGLLTDQTSEIAGIEKALQELFNAVADARKNVASADKLANARSIFGRSFDGTADVKGQGEFYGSSNLFGSGALQIRESGLVENTGTGGSEENPTIGFHWGKRAGSTMQMDSKGDFHLKNQTNDGVRLLNGLKIETESNGYRTYLSNTFNGATGNHAGICLFSTGVSSQQFMLPMADNTTSLGNGSTRWKDVHALNATIQTSDERDKKEVKSLDLDVMKELVAKIIPVSYKWRENESDRTHYGMIAQRVEDVISELGIDSKDFAPLIKSPVCNEIEVESEDGTKVLKQQETGDYKYGLRYSELIPIMWRVMQYLLKENETMREELSKLSASER